MGNFEQLADDVINRMAHKTGVSCFPTLDEETGNIMWFSGNGCRNIDGCKNQRTLMGQGGALETWMETSEKLRLPKQKLFSPNSATKCFLFNKQITICTYVKILKLTHFIRKLSILAGGDEEEFLSSIINETICEWYDNLDIAIGCYYDNCLSWAGKIG